MTRYVIDASAVLALVLGEELEEADRFWLSVSADDELIGAQMVMAECTSVIRRTVFRNLITESEGFDALEDALALRITVSTDERQFTRALELATIRGTPKAYDMQYLAVAELENLQLITADHGLWQAAITIKHPVRYLR